MHLIFIDSLHTRKNNFHIRLGILILRKRSSWSKRKIMHILTWGNFVGFGSKTKFCAIILFLNGVGKDCKKLIFWWQLLGQSFLNSVFMILWVFSWKYNFLFQGVHFILRPLVPDIRFFTAQHALSMFEFGAFETEKVWWKSLSFKKKNWRALSYSFIIFE